MAWVALDESKGSTLYAWRSQGASTNITGYTTDDEPWIKNVHCFACGEDWERESMNVSELVAWLATHEKHAKLPQYVDTPVQMPLPGITS